MPKGNKRDKEQNERIERLEAQIAEQASADGDVAASSRIIFAESLKSIQELEEVSRRLLRKVKRMTSDGSSGSGRSRRRRGSDGGDGLLDGDLLKAIRAMSLDTVYAQIETFDREYERGPRPASYGYPGPWPYTVGIAGQDVVDRKVALWFYDKQVQAASISRQRTSAQRMEILMALFTNGLSNKKESGGSFLEIALLMSAFNPAGTGSGGNLINTLIGGISLVIPAEDYWRRAGA